MAVSTSNIYGNISISDDAIARVAAHAALECYGIVELVSHRLKDTISDLFNKGAKGIRVDTVGDKIYIDIFVIIKFGVSISAVAESLKQSVKYQVEKFTGMIVDTVNVSILGVKL
jgi:uncharacterized alkaline shock family protein YloU